MRMIPKALFTWVESFVDPFAPYPAYTPGKGPWKFIAWNLRPFRKILVLGALVASGVAIFEMLLIWYAGRLVDLMNAGQAGFWAENGFEILLAALGLLVLRPVMAALNAAVLFSGISTNMLPQVRWRAYRQLLGQPVGFFQNDFAGRLTNRVMTTGVATEDTSFLLFEAFWQAASFAIATLVVLSGFSLWLAVPMAIWIFGFVGFIIWFAPRVGDISEANSHANSRVTARIVDSFSNIEAVKLFAHSDREQQYVQSAIKRHRLRFSAMMAIFAEQQAAMAIFNSAAFAMVIAPALWVWTQGGLTTGEVAAAIAMALRLNTMTGWIMWMTVRTAEHLGTIREGLQSLSVPQTVLDKSDAKPLLVTAGRIEIRGLTHHYGKGKGGLNGVDLDIRGGEKVGLVGRSGAGKSSLVNLILRLRDAEGGQIVIDGQDIAGVRQDTLRGAIGMVTQDSSLLHRSVRDNIKYGRPDATEAQMIAAARKAEADGFIASLEDNMGRRGFDALVGERGVRLSGGQRQRISLARVILKDAPILILDEATSALDSEVEAAIQTTLDRMMEGKTVIAIAHRLSTIARMDRIIVLDQGRVVEQGPHDDLLAQGGIYARLWQHQSGGFLGEDA